MADLMTGPLIHGGVGELVVVGEVDLSDADELAAGALRVLDSGASGVVLDLSAVTFIDSSGLGALIRIREMARTRGKSLVLANPSHPVTKVLTITALLRVFDIDRHYAPSPDLGRC